MTLNPASLDVLVRTVIGEAANEGPDGWAAVAHTIRNRTRDPRWPDDPRAVALQPKQFSAWNKGAGGNNLVRKYGPNDPLYQKVAKVVLDSFYDQHPDITRGATHYYSPAGMDALVKEGAQSNRSPRWLREETNRRGEPNVKVGGHIFTGRTVADSGQTMNDAGPQQGGWREMVRQQTQPQAQPQAPSGGGWRDMVRQRTGAPEPQAEPEPKPQEATSPSFIDRLGEATGMMVNDMNAGFQGVNPVSVAQSSPIGRVIQRRENSALVEVEGGVKEIPQEEFGQYVTQTDPESGMELVYRRTPEMEENPLASAGRVVGYGIPSEMANIGRAAVARSANVAQDATDIGVTPSLGMTGKTGAIAAGAGESVITTAGPVTRDAQRAVGEIAQAAERSAASVGTGAGRIDAGTALISGANDFVLRNLRGSDEVVSTSQRLFNRVDELIPTNTRISAGNIGRLLQDYLSRFADAPNISREVGNAKWQGWLDDIVANNGSLTWEQAKDLRTAVGSALRGKSGEPLTDKATGQLKQIYSALTSDMEAAARRVGQPALQAWTRANTHYRAASARAQEALDIIFKAKGEEAAFESVLALTKDKGARSNVAKLAKIKKSMPTDDWSVVVATVVRRMGDAGDNFSPAQFVTEWGKMSDEAKDILFSGKGVPKGLRIELDKLFRVAERAKTATKHINFSRSGTTASAAGYGAWFMVDPISAATAAVVSNLSARAITNPHFLRAARAYAATGGSKASAQRLISMAKRNPALANEVGAVLRLQEQRSAQPPGLPAPVAVP